MNIHEDGKLGPKMLALPNDRWREFVLHIMRQGRRNATMAYRAVWGQTSTIEVTQACASRLFHDTRIQEALHEEAAKRVKALVPLALKTVADILEDPESKERGKMALGILDRAGLAEVKETRTTIEFIGADPERIRRLTVLAMQMGIPVEKLLGQRLASLAPPVQDAEFEEVE